MYDVYIVCVCVSVHLPPHLLPQGHFPGSGLLLRGFTRDLDSCVISALEYAQI